MRPWLALVAVALSVLPSAARGQVSTDEAYRRMQERAAAHAKAVVAAPPPQRVAAPAPAKAEPAGPFDTRPAADPDSALLQARAGFRTALRPDVINPQDDHGQKPDAPPATVARLTKVRTALGPMWAYLTPDPGDGQRHPAVVWIHGGHAGLGSGLFSRSEPADNDQTPNAFLDAHFVVMCPSFRGHNDNPGTWEMFYGEVDDCVAAIDHLSKLPYVDPKRIYLVGHSTGGTMTLVTAEASGKLRAAFSLCGCPDVQALVTTEADHHGAPFDFNDSREGGLRSAVNYADHLHTPTWFFDQADSFYVHGGLAMSLRAGAAHAPFTAMFLTPATHFDVVRPLTQLIAAKLRADTGPTCNFAATEREISDAFGRVFPGRRETVTVAASSLPVVRVTSLAKQLLALACRQQHLDPGKMGLILQSDGGGYAVHATVVAENAESVTVPADGVPIVVSDTVLNHLGPTTIAVTMAGGSLGWTAAAGADGAPAEPDIVITPAGVMGRPRP